jgi:hypothetical protein
MQSVNGLEEPFSKTAEKNFLQPTRSGCISLSVHLSVCLFIRPSVRNTKNTQILNIRIKIRVPTWSFLSVAHSLRIPIPICEEKFWVQQENSYIYLLIVYVYYQPNSCNKHTEREWVEGTFLRQQKKSSSSPRAVGIPGGT